MFFLYYVILYYVSCFVWIPERVAAAFATANADSNKIQKYNISHTDLTFLLQSIFDKRPSLIEKNIMQRVWKIALWFWGHGSIFSEPYQGILSQPNRHRVASAKHPLELSWQSQIVSAGALHAGSSAWHTQTAGLSSDEAAAEYQTDRLSCDASGDAASPTGPSCRGKTCSWHNIHYSDCASVSCWIIQSCPWMERHPDCDIEPLFCRRRRDVWPASRPGRRMRRRGRVTSRPCTRYLTFPMLTPCPYLCLTYCTILLLSQISCHVDWPIYTSALTSNWC